MTFDTRAARLAVTLLPVALALALPSVAYQRWRRDERALRLREPLPPSALPIVLTIGAIALAAVVACLAIAGALGG